QELLRRDADCRARRARAHAGRAAFDPRTHVALDRQLGLFALRVGLAPGVARFARSRPGAEQDPAQERGLAWRLRVHPDHAIRAVALAVAAADAGLGDEHLAVGPAADRVGRTVGHAVRVLAVSARGRHVQVGVSPPGLAVEPAEPVVAVGAGFLAVVAADAQGLVDQQHVGRLADAVVDEELRGFRIVVDRAAEAVLAALDELGHRAPPGHVGQRLVAQPRLRLEQRDERLAGETHDFAADRRLDRRGALRAVDRGHLAEVGARRQVREEHRLTADR